MENNYIITLLDFFIIISILLFILFISTSSKRNKELYLLDIAKKFDDYMNFQKISFIFADEVKRLLDADFVAVVEYTYSQTEILATIPSKSFDKDLTNPHELFLILKNLQQSNISFIETEDIQSEHFKKYFPIFNYAKYKIIPVYTDETKIITLEIYGETKSIINLKKHMLMNIIELFRNAYIRIIKIEKDVLKSKKNDIIIRFLDRIRNTLDEEELEKIILEEVSRAFKADRSYFIATPNQSPYTPVLGKEYLGNPYAKSLRGNGLDFKSVWQQLKENNMNPPVFVIENSEKFIRQNSLENTPIEIYIKKSQIKSSYPFLIYQDDYETLYIVIHFIKENIIFDKDDFEIMELLTKQSHIALTQARIYTKLLSKNKKEKLLKEISSDIFSLHNKKQIYDYFAQKIMQLIYATGVVFIDFKNTEENAEYFEHYKNNNISLAKFKNFSDIKEIINKKSLIYTCDLVDKVDNVEFINFLKSTNTVCLLTIPFGENSLILIFLDKKKDFTHYEKEIISSIIDIISKTVMDTINRSEINNLRESFLGTLAHDLQIPLIAERNAINYLIQNQKNSNDEKLNELLKNLQETNSQAEDMIKALTAIYKYESKKKEINKSECNLFQIIDDSIARFNKSISNKKIKINKSINTENTNIFADKIELSKVIIIILQNAIDNTDENGNIDIDISENNKYLKCCISVNTNYSEDKIRNIFFDRNILTNNLEHRVGEGIYLYLAKLIILAHSGKIYINNKFGQGNIFCIEIEKII